LKEEGNKEQRELTKWMAWPFSILSDGLADCLVGWLVGRALGRV